VVSGFSAGGHLALMAGMTPPGGQLGPVTRVAAVIDFYGVTDLAESLDQKREDATQWIPEQEGRLELAKMLSPMSYVRKDVPPILIIHGDGDDQASYQQSVRLSAALKQAGAKQEMITVPGGKHGFTGAQLADLWPKIFKWLKKVKVTT